MNYYSFHIGDYLSATAHLSLIEHGAYRRLLDIYYIHEAPLPLDERQIYRLAGARSKEEKEAIDSILAEFFMKAPDGFRHDRCDHEISLCNKNRLNGAKGGRPPKNKNPKETQNETEAKPKQNPNRNPTVTQAESPPSPHHPITPSPHHGEQPASASPTGVARADGSSAPRTSPGVISGVMRRSGVQSNPADPRIMALAEAGVSAETVAAACAEAKAAKPDERIPPGYVLAIIERWGEEARRAGNGMAQAPPGRGNGRASAAQERAKVSEVLTGRKGDDGENGGSGGRDITGEAVRVA